MIPSTPLIEGPLAFLIAAALGLMLGSFASAMSWRIPRNLSWVRARSSCTGCGHNLGGLDLIPIVSWVLLRGRCRYCRALIGLRYPLIELSTVCLCLGVCAAYGLTWAGLVIMLAVPFLVAMIVIDFDYMILPDQLNIILFILGFVFTAIGAGLGDTLIGGISAVLYAGLLWATGWVMTKFLRRDAVGFGDVKFMAVAGMWLHFPMLPGFLILSGVCGVISALIWKIMGRGARFPFGPALILAFLICLLYSGGVLYATLYALGFRIGPG